METVFSLLALYDGNSPVTGELVYVLCARQPKIELSRFYISYLAPALWKKLIGSMNTETFEAIFTIFLKKFIKNGIILDLSHLNFSNFNKSFHT